MVASAAHTNDLPRWLDAVADELNHLLWEPAFLNRGAPDLGWACRDHAALLAACLLSEGFKVEAVSGNIVWVQSQGPAGPSFGLGAAAEADCNHTWLRVAGQRIDVSARLSRSVVPGGGVFPGTDERARLLDAPPPGVRVQHLATQAEYAHAVQLAQRRAGLTGLYWERESRALGAADLLDPHVWPKSPTSDRLVAAYGPDIYLRAVSHLVGVARDPDASLVGKPQRKAWKKIAALQPATLPAS